MTARSAALAVLAGCALTSKSPPRELRFFAPPVAEDAARGSAATCARVRIGRVTASSHLRAAIEHRRSPVEIEPYDTLRWTEAPEVYVRRAVVRTLFDARPLGEAVAGAAPVLDVEAIAFEELVSDASHAGRVELRYELRDDRVVLGRGDIRVDRAARSAAIEDVVAAIASAMDAAAGELGDRVVAASCPAPR